MRTRACPYTQRSAHFPSLQSHFRGLRQHFGAALFMTSRMHSREDFTHRMYIQEFASICQDVRVSGAATARLEVPRHIEAVMRLWCTLL